MNLSRPLVSIVVRTKDRPHLLKEALGSLHDQTYRPLEVILVNDGGCMLSRGIYQNSLKDIPLKEIAFEENQGRAKAGNAGIEAAKGHYIGFLDDDDRLLPDHVELLVACLEGGDYKVCYSDAEICQRVFDPGKKEFELRDCRLFVSRDFRLLDLFLENFIPLPCVLFTRSSLLEVGGFDTSFELYEDWDLLLRVASLHPFYHIPKVTVRYIQWSRELQIAQIDTNQGLQQFNYGRIIEKHRHLLTSEMARHILSSLKELERFRHENERLKALQEQFAPRIGALTQQQENLKRRLTEVVEEKRRLEDQLSLIQRSRAWKLVQRYGRFRSLLRFLTFKRKQARRLQP